MMDGIIVALAALTAGVGVAMIVRAVQIGKQFQATQRRIAELELRVKELTEREVLPALDAAQSLNARVDRLRQNRGTTSSQDGGFWLDGWADYLPKLVEIVARFSDPGRKPGDKGEK